METCGTLALPPPPPPPVSSVSLSVWAVYFLVSILPVVRGLASVDSCHVSASFHMRHCRGLLSCMPACCAVHDCGALSPNSSRLLPCFPCTALAASAAARRCAAAGEAAAGSCCCPRGSSAERRTAWTQDGTGQPSGKVYRSH